jgi:hypothetical protein
VLAYFRSFDLAAIARTRDGRLVATRDPAGYSQAPGEATAEERDVQMLPLPHEPRDPVFGFASSTFSRRFSTFSGKTQRGS